MTKKIQAKKKIARKSGPQRHLMPDGAAERAVLSARAKAIASVGKRRLRTEDDARYLRVRISQNELCGLMLTELDEVIEISGMAAVPGAPVHIKGIASRRGELIAVLDLAAFFGIGSCSATDTAKIVVVNCGGRTIGLLVEEIEGQVDFHSDELSPSPATSQVDSQFVSGVHDTVVSILDMNALVSHPSLSVNDTVSDALVAASV